MRALLPALLLSAATAAQSAAPRPQVQLIGVIRDASVSEISGAAISHRDAARIYAINDSQNSASLHVLTRDGGATGKVDVENAENHDWEDLSAFVLDGRSYLLIADTGDNGGLRESLQLIVVAEPERPLPGSIAIAWQIPFRLPEGRRDIEAVAVDSTTESVYLIAKRHFPRVLYRLPLRPDPLVSLHVAERVGTFNTLPPATDAEKSRNPKFGRFIGDVTALALDPHGHYALVLSYRDLYFYPRGPDETLLEALSRKPRRMRLPVLSQSEAIALDAGRREAIVLAERMLAPIYKVSIP